MPVACPSALDAVRLPVTRCFACNNAAMNTKTSPLNIKLSAALPVALDERYRAAVAWFKTVVKNPNMLDGARTAADASRYAVYANREPDLLEWLKS